jgi:hypothetical protein
LHFFVQAILVIGREHNRMLGMADMRLIFSPEMRASKPSTGAVHQIQKNLRIPQKPRLMSSGGLR